MKLFSSFNTNLDQEKLKEFQDKYKGKKILLIRKSSMFFWMRVFPIIIASLLLFSSLFGLKIVIKDNFNIYVTGAIIMITIITFGSRLIKLIIDYKMDFTIVTPDEIITYEQEGFFKKIEQSISESKINSIVVNKQSLMYSIWNNGIISILAEGGSSNGEIHIKYVYDPETVKYQIVDTINQK